jgi:hypothetical protein
MIQSIIPGKVCCGATGKLLHAIRLAPSSSTAPAVGVTALAFFTSADGQAARLAAGGERNGTLTIVDPENGIALTPPPALRARAGSRAVTALTSFQATASPFHPHLVALTAGDPEVRVYDADAASGGLRLLHSLDARADAGGGDCPVAVAVYKEPHSGADRIVTAGAYLKVVVPASSTGPSGHTPNGAMEGACAAH